MNQFNSQEENAIRDKNWMKPVQSNCLYCIIKYERYSVVLYYLAKREDEMGRRIEIRKEEKIRK